GLVAGLDRVHRTAVTQQGEHGQPVGLQGVVADEGGGLQLGDQVGGQLHAATKPAGRARGLALPVHRRVEAGGVHGHAAFAGDVLGEVEGEAVGVVEAERIGAGDGPAAGLLDDV